MKVQSDKSDKQAADRLWQAQAAEKRTQEAEERRKAEAEERRKAEAEAKHAKVQEYGTKSRFTALFAANEIFTAALAFFMLYDRRSVLVECGKWFADRGKGIAVFFRWWGWLYMSMAHGMEGWKWSVPLCFILAVVFLLLIIAALIGGIGFCLIKLHEVIENIKSEYLGNELFKGSISVSIALILFFVCLWFYAPIKAAFHLNIFSLWLIFSIIGVLIWNSPEIVRGLKQ
jgi:hypothetical protein